jgi:hypothetical protein
MRNRKRTVVTFSASTIRHGLGRVSGWRLGWTVALRRALAGWDDARCLAWSEKCRPDRV